MGRAGGVKRHLYPILPVQPFILEVAGDEIQPAAEGVSGDEQFVGADEIALRVRATRISTA